MFSLQLTHEQPSTASTLCDDEYDKKVQVNTYRESNLEDQIIEEDNDYEDVNASYPVDTRKSFYLKKNKGSCD